MKQILSKSVVLTGLMGTGKTIVGTILSKKLGVHFSDSDELIESSQGKSISEIFKDNGENYFRGLEEDVFFDLLSLEPQIISSGGGSILSKTTRQEIGDKCYSIWLRSNAETIAGRIRKTKTRPLLRSGNIKNTLRKKMQEREKFYKMANFHVVNESQNIENLVEQIIERLIEKKVLIE